MEEKIEKEFIPVMLTPFKENGKIDFDGLASLTELYLRAGVKGLFANCQSSEMFQLSNDERLAIIRHAVKIAKGKVPIVAVGNFGKTIQEQADFIHKVNDTGVRAVIVVTGIIAGEDESNEVFDERMFELFKLTDSIPLGFYECPEPYKRVLTAEQLGKFVNTGRIIYHKDTCLDSSLIKQKIKTTNAFPSFGLYDAYAVNALSSLEAGAAGLSCIQGNFFPEMLVWLCAHWNDKDRKADVTKAQQFLTDHMTEMHEAYPVVAKYYLHKKGLNISTFTRAKTDEFTREMKEKVDRLFDQYEQLKEEMAF
jgi:4-hydroxy-tetrahydrodipicolinate synthase